MHANTPSLLRCPVCAHALTHTSEGPGRGWLTCTGCRSAGPILRGMPLLTEWGELPQPELAVLEARVLGAPGAYAAFLDRKRRRHAFDAYAAFEPFNEANRAILRLLPLLRSRLQPGEVIVDVGCRTGWTGELLAARFPQQRVIAAWTGDRDVLGYRGFDHWLGAGLPNLEWMFFDPDKGLPFADGSLGMIHAHDALHNVDISAFIGECLRAVRPRGPLVFPHVHLDEVDFDRGGVHLGAAGLHAALEAALSTARGAGRRALVLDERVLFGATAGITVPTAPWVDHYNGCVLIGEPADAGRRIPPADDAITAAHRVFLSPLLAVDPATGAVAVDRAGMAGAVQTLLRRHRVYAAALHATGARDRLDRMILHLAGLQCTVGQIAARLQRPIAGRLRALEAAELVRLEATSAGMAALHGYYARQESGRSIDTLPALWASAVARHSARPLLLWPPDGSVFRYTDADAAVRLAAGFLAAAGVRAGDRVGVQAGSHPELFLLLWGTWLLGGVAVILPAELSPARLRALVDRAAVSLLLVEGAAPLPAAGRHVTVRRYGEAGDLTATIAAATPLTGQATVRADADAAVLFTSGSTGPPKAVRLTHGALVRSGRLVTELWQWTEADRVLALGSPHTMSGLRNAFISPLHVGASVVLPAAGDRRHVVAIARCLSSTDCTLLTAVPALLRACLRAPTRLRGLLSGLRAVLCTGAPLHPPLRARFEEALGLPVFDYYGLTETCGLCLGTSADAREGVGRPQGAQVAVLGADGETLPIGEVGELVVYSANLSPGYLGGRPLHLDALGWLRTGDRARITASGCVVLVGRSDRLLVHRSGDNLQPEAIERALLTAGAGEAFVGMVCDADRIPQLVAAVCDDAPSDAILSAAVQAQLSPLHVPERFVRVSALPLTDGGVVDREAVQAALHSA